MLRDRLVCGVSNHQIQKRLLAEPGLKYQKAVELALAMESASKNVGDLHMTKTNANSARSTEYVDRVAHGKRTSLGKRNEECYRCGGDHEASTCKFKDAKCYSCQKKGHTASKCRNRNKDLDKKSLRKVEKKGQKSSNYFLDAPDLKDKAEGEYTMYRVTGGKNKAITIDINLCGTRQTMELDTGASKTTLNHRTYTKLRRKLGPLKETEALLSTYTGERIPVAGVVSVPVKYGDQEVNLSALVIRGDGPNLLGRDWLGVIRINWSQIFKVEAKQQVVNHGLSGC